MEEMIIKVNKLIFFDYFLYLAFLPLNLVFIFYESTPIAIMLLLLIGTISYNKPYLGLALWILTSQIAPNFYNPYFFGELPFSVLLNYFLIAGVVLNYTKNHILSSYLNANKGKLIFGFLLIYISTVSLFYNSGRMSTYVIFISMIIIFFIVIDIMKNSEIASKFILNTLVLTAVFTLLTSFYTDGISRRLRLAGSVRGVANIVGLGIIILISSLIFEDKYNFRKIGKKDIIIYLTLGFLFLGLFLTNSRGVILAVLFSITAMFFSRFRIKIKGKVAIPKLRKAIIFSVLIVLVVFSFLFTRQFDLFIERLDICEFSFPRIERWISVFREMNAGQLIFGGGPGRFRDIAVDKVGVDTYAHSTYIDFLVSLGFLGFFLLLSKISLVLKGILNKKNHLLFGLFIFLIFNFFTHGSITSYYFWIVFGVVAGNY